ncbi:hypothetical protein CEE44_04315 [Candidatus Woesearchaeota archaeon B3_Woes]|nr:MAG: hypothetical protein CEE44_04315 [Candidatus Woesearchaeota archaeon B3_Woes]
MTDFKYNRGGSNPGVSPAALVSPPNMPDLYKKGGLPPHLLKDPLLNEKKVGSAYEGYVQNYNDPLYMILGRLQDSRKMADNPDKALNAALSYMALDPSGSYVRA